MQVDARERGFSYSYDAPLDMRMDPSQELDAREVVNEWDERRLAQIFRALRRGAQRAPDRARDRQAPARARAARDHRRAGRGDRGGAARRRRRSFGGGHPAKRVFQAIRIAVNDELDSLDRALPLGVGPAAAGRPPGRDLLPLARGPARQALPRRARARLHLPARLPGLRVRPRARGRAAHRPRRWRPRPARSRRTRARSRAGCAPPAASRRGTRPDGPRRRSRRRASAARGTRPAPRPARASRRAAARAPPKRPARRAPRRGAAAAPAALRGAPRRGRAPLGARVLDAPAPRPRLDRPGRRAARGIVFLNVDLLEMNREIAQMAERAAELKRENARACATTSPRLADSERIQQAAAERGLVLPAPGEVRYLRVEPGDRRAARAAKRITAPEPRARARAADAAPPTTGGTADRAEPDAADRSARRPPRPTTPPTSRSRRRRPRHRGGLRASHGLAGAPGRAPDRAALRALPVLLVAARRAPPGSARSRPARSRERAVQQQVEDLDVPARRGTITDRHGVELAVSEDAITVFANPFLIDEPGRVAARLAPLLGRLRGRAARASWRPRRGLRLPAPQARRRARATQVEQLEIEGIGTVVEPQAHATRRATSARSCSARWAPTTTGLAGLEQSQEETLRGATASRRLVKDALGEPVSIVETERAEAGRGPAGSRSTPRSRSASRPCSARWARPTSRGAPPRS